MMVSTDNRISVEAAVVANTVSPKKPVGNGGLAPFIAALLLFAGCDRAPSELPPKSAFGTEPGRGPCWSDEKPSFMVQDIAGQVYWLRQHQTNSNIYVVWLNQGETNGITNSFGYRTFPVAMHEAMKAIE